MIIAGLIIAAVLGGGAGTARQDPDRAADRLAFTCLSEGQMLFVAGLAVAVQSPNANAATQTARIAETCGRARTGLAPDGHVCLPAVAELERLATELSGVYSGRVTLAEYTSRLAAVEAYTSEDDDEEWAIAEQCDGRMAALQATTEENQ